MRFVYLFVSPYIPADEKHLDIVKNFSKIFADENHRGPKMEHKAVFALSTKFDARGGCLSYC